MTNNEFCFDLVFMIITQLKAIAIVDAKVYFKLYKIFHFCIHRILNERFKQSQR